MRVNELIDKLRSRFGLVSGGHIKPVLKHCTLSHAKTSGQTLTVKDTSAYAKPFPFLKLDSITISGFTEFISRMGGLKLLMAKN